MNAKSPALLVVIVLLLAGAVFFVLGGSNGSPEPGVEGALAPGAATSAALEPRPVTPTREVEKISLPSSQRESVEDLGPTTVLWPLEVRLELEAPSGMPTRDGLGDVPAIGSGANARLTGRVGSRIDRGAMAVITFIAGPNTGRVLATDAEGRFGATNLWPGLSIVTIEGPGLVGAEREVRLRQRREAVLNIGFGRLGAVQGEVVGPDKQPVEGALVRIDGHETQTDTNGIFYIGNLASGQSTIEIESSGSSSHREMVNITANATVPLGRLKYVLDEAATLIVTVEGSVGGPGPVELWLSPANPKRLSGFPFWRINPIRLLPGEQREITNLPRELIHVQAFRVGAACNPETRNVNLRASNRMPLNIDLRSAEKIVGRVLQDGQPAVGATVTLEAPDRVQAALRHYRQPASYLESAFLPFGPEAVQTVETDALGRFTLTAWTDGSSSRYLGAVSKDGRRTALRLIDETDRDLSLDLRPKEAGAGVLVLEPSDRFQGLPVVWTMNGEPGPDLILPPGEPLEFGGLREGLWTVEVVWSAEQVLLEEHVEVTKEGTTLGLNLPEGAITGQDREAWTRAGRDYPY